MTVLTRLWTILWACSTNASFTGLLGQDGAEVGYDGNYSLPRDGLLEFEMDPLVHVVSTIVSVFFGIIGLAGLLGNALVILALFCRVIIRYTTNADFLLVHVPRLWKSTPGCKPSAESRIHLKE
ncbi:uncharacterized protein LOC126759726 [Bactrocera neohumeralis]|uniref:uncharacterized protein LOC126759726 n=1 Tax=Bactrocera neohumeralis TaxID=98809 RepID=UPI002165DB5C|nr:uncharacterized protein LOC126759726 [Bactrocera neohumeralis]